MHHVSNFIPSRKNQCACHALTVEAGKSVKSTPKGYHFRRLEEPVTAGVYECNSTCACASTCLNRVAQRPFRNKLQVLLQGRLTTSYIILQQVFKTASRGWGIRTLVDMPGGAFVCTYVGNLYTAEESNSVGKNFGDEYFAELDLVENVEGHKDGWESDVIEPGEEEFDKEESKVDETEDVKLSVDDAEDEAAGEGTSKKRRSSRLAVVQQEKRKKKLEDSKKGRMESARKLFGMFMGCC